MEIESSVWREENHIGNHMTFNHIQIMIRMSEANEEKNLSRLERRLGSS